MKPATLTALCAALCTALCATLLGSCADRQAVRVADREQLFSLGYGVLEDQLNLFSLGGMAPPSGARIAMRDGIFFVSDGNAAKVMILSSFGDLLSMIYDPERNPAPVVLTPAEPGAAVQGRAARTYPFNEPGAIAVDSAKTLYVQERVPEDRRAYDESARARLEYVVLRFSRDGEYLDFLGQEGVGGTPFPVVTGLFITPADECVVTTMTGEGWSVYWFDQRGLLLSTIAIRRDGVPLPDDEPGLFPSMDGMAPAPDGSGLLFKTDYYRELVDEETGTREGIEFASTWIWRMDRTSAAFVERYEIPAFESLYAARTGQDGVPRSWDFAGAAVSAVFLSAVDEDGSTYYGLYDLADRTLKRYSVRIEDDELLYTDFSLSSEGILLALLGTRYEARVVWWRFDRLLGNLVP